MVSEFDILIFCSLNVPSQKGSYLCVNSISVKRVIFSENEKDLCTVFGDHQVRTTYLVANSAWICKVNISFKPSFIKIRAELLAPCLVSWSFWERGQRMMRKKRVPQKGGLETHHQLPCARVFISKGEHSTTCVKRRRPKSKAKLCH